MTGPRTLCGLLGPAAGCRNGVGTKQSQVCSMTKFCNFSPDGASRSVHISAVRAAAIVTVYST